MEITSCTLSELIQQINAAGLIVNNICQLDTGIWRASVRLDVTFEFGEGMTAAEALFDAKQKIFREPLRNNPPPLSKKLTLEDLGL